MDLEKYDFLALQTLLVNLFQLPDADLGVDRRCTDICMPELLLDKPDVSPILKHVGSSSMTQGMTGGSTLDLRLVEVALHHVGYGRCGESSSSVGQEEMARVTTSSQEWSYLTQVLVDPLQGS